MRPSGQAPITFMELFSNTCVTHRSMPALFSAGADGQAAVYSEPIWSHGRWTHHKESHLPLLRLAELAYR